MIYHLSSLINFATVLLWLSHYTEKCSSVMFHIVNHSARFRRYQREIHNKLPIRQKQLIQNVRKNGWWQAWANKELSRYYGMAARHSQLTIDAHRFKPPRPVFCWVHLSVNGKHVYYRLSRTVWLLQPQRNTKVLYIWHHS